MYVVSLCVARFGLGWAYDVFLFCMSHVHAFSCIRTFIVFGLSFLTTLNIYKDYFKGRQRLPKCEVKLRSCKLWPETEFVLVHLSFEEAAVFLHLRVLWPKSCSIFIVWWTKKFCNQHLSQVSDQVAYWDPRLY